MEALKLNARRYGEGDRVFVLCHGLLGSSRNWQALAKAWARERRVLAVDMRDHGASPHAETTGYHAMAADLEAFAREEARGRADVLGHSMGGKAAMALALLHPEAVERLVVVDVAPVPYAHGFEDYIQALQALDLASMRRRSEADAALAPAVHDPGVRAFLLQNLEDDGNGRLVFRPNLAGLLAGMDRIAGWPEGLDDRRFEGPALFVRGERSDYVLDEHAARIRSLFPKARIETVAGAGHWVHAEAPRELGALVSSFLNEER